MNSFLFRRLTFFTVSLFLLAGVVPAAKAADRYVDAAATGSVHNGQSWATAWTSFAQIAQSGLAGDDIVWIKSGTYNERFSITKGGTSGHRITYIGTGPSKPILRGIAGGSSSYIAIINLEITHLSSSNSYDAIILQGCNGWLIEDNYIHYTYMNGVNCSSSSTNSYNIIRHNTFDDIGGVGAGYGGGSNPTVINMNGNFNLVEYNSVTLSMDRSRAFGTGNVIRNNYWGATDTPRYNMGPQNPSHTDGFQSFDPGPFAQFLYEGNYDTDNKDSVGGNNAHTFLIQDAPGTHNFNWIMLRFNLWLRVGGGGPDIQNVSRSYFYNNTAVALNIGIPGTYGDLFAYTYPNTLTPSSSDIADVRNNVLAYSPKTLGNNHDNNAGPVEYLPTNFTHAANLFFNSGGTQAKYPAVGLILANLLQTDPKFTDGTGVAGHDDYTMLSSSPLKGAGAPITNATGIGINSTSLTVVDAKRLFDGWGIADGDWIRIGILGTLVQISSINYSSNVVTLAAPRTWILGDGVWVKGTEDVGALPFAYAKPITVTNTSPALVGGANTLSATVNNPDAVRMVEFLVDGLPVGLANYNSSNGNYTVSYNSDGNSHSVVARAYSAWASATPTVEGSGPPTNARIGITVGP